MSITDAAIVAIERAGITLGIEVAYTRGRP